MTRSETVLFVCLHASAKSFIAMEYFNRLAALQGSRLRALSAGTEPDDAIPPEEPLRLTPALVAGAAAVISFGPDIDALAPASVPVAHWDDMPAVSDDYARARDAIRARVGAFFSEIAGVNAEQGDESR